MTCIYCTADKIGIQTGGGIVTHHEAEAMRSFSNGDIMVWGRDQMNQANGKDPWLWDDYTRGLVSYPYARCKLAHFYAGTFSRTVSYLKGQNSKVTYTAAAHDVTLSRQEHQKLGMYYDYPHMTIPSLWERYLQGYLDADVLICPSPHSANVMKGFGAKNRIEIIPHGVDIPEPKPSVKQSQFTVGYLGAVGPDKGLIYLLEAWKKLNYHDATLLLAGGASTSPFVKDLIRGFGGGNIECLGWVDDLSKFYESLSLYVQPSVTEGFGIEVLEACAHGVRTIACKGAGASYLLPPPWNMAESKNVDQLVYLIDFARRNCDYDPEQFRDIARNCTWDKIHKKYQDVWRSLLDEKS